MSPVQTPNSTSLGANMPANPTKSDYTFAGWSTDSSATTVNFYSTTPVTANITVYAVWQAVIVNSCAVSFNIDGVITIVRVPCGSGLGANMPGNPTKTCYDFIGWNLSSLAADGNFTSATSVTADITVFAIWKIKTYIVTFNPDNGTANIEKTVNHGSSLGASFPADPLPLRSEYKFEGWFDSSNNQFTNLTIVTGDITVKARWGMNGDGTSQNPYIIMTAEQLDNVRNNLSAHYKLGTDIDLTGWGGSSGWSPIGTSASTAFTGKIDGFGYKITGMRIGASSISTGLSYYRGLFGYVSRGEITNLILENVDISSYSYSYSYSYSGGIAGYVYGSIISNSYSTGNIYPHAVSGYAISYSYSGGIAGYVTNNSIISNSYSTADISASSVNSYSGGIAGYVSSSTISNSYAFGDISVPAPHSYSGGIAGYVINNSTISNSYSFGDISAQTNSNLYSALYSDSHSYSGGIAGYVSTKSTITNSYSTGYISASDDRSNNSYSGGIAGYLTDSSTITNSYSTGDISASDDRSNNSYSGGIAGYLTSSSTITNCYSTGDIFSSANSGGIAGYLTSSSTITNSYSTGYISAASYSSYSGGIAGVGTNNCTITNSAAINKHINAYYYAGRIAMAFSCNIYNNFALSTMTDSGNAKFYPEGISIHNGVSKTDAQLKTQDTYSGAINGDGLGGLGWKFGTNDDNPWKMPSGGGYPILYWQQ